MWWLDPGKEVLNILFNRILAPYVENLDMGQVNYGIGQGQLTLRNLRLKKGALDKFRLPVDVIAGHLGKFTLSLHWMNLGNQPVEILIEDIYLLVVPSTESAYNQQEEEDRAQAAKAERLENAELLHMRGQGVQGNDGSAQSQGLIQSLISKIVNNLQITVKRIHIRYEDKLSVPGHPFAGGITLSGFTAVSVNGEWEPAFIESTAGAIHKLADLSSLAVYFDTDSPSMAGLPHPEFVKKFGDMISHDKEDSSHQFILRPVTGQGRITLNHHVDEGTPRINAELLFDEIGVSLDDNQYRDAISLVDMFHVYARQHQYRKHRPDEDAFEENAAAARLQYAKTAILEGVRERHRKWTWRYFAERRDDRHRYTDLFQKKLLAQLYAPELHELERLERKLSYEDLRFYRSIVRSRLRKDEALKKKLEEEKAKKQPEAKGWGSWIWGSGSGPSSQEQPSEQGFDGNMSEQQRKELYDVLDFDEKNAVAESLQAPRDSMKAKISASLRKGSLVLRSDPHGKAEEIISVEFDDFKAGFIQRPDNFEATASLGDFAVFDGTTENTLHPQIVQVQQDVDEEEETGEAFLSVKYEKNPLDERADNALTVRLRHMEIVYHKGYVEAVHKFFKPPESQLESVEALLVAASETLEGLSKETRANLEFALQNHKTIDVQMDLKAPVIIIPEDVTTYHCQHLIIDAGHIAISSELADKEVVRSVQSKRSYHDLAQHDKDLESLMYDKFALRLERAQFVIGKDFESSRNALSPDNKDKLHLLEETSIDLQLSNSIVPSAYNLARFKVSGRLPKLQVNLSDMKYKALMRLIDVSIPKFGDDEEAAQVAAPPKNARPPPGGFPMSRVFSKDKSQEYHIEEEDKEEFFEADTGVPDDPSIHQRTFKLDFQVDELQASLAKVGDGGVEKQLGNVSLNNFALQFGLSKFDMQVDVHLRSIGMTVTEGDSKPMTFISSATDSPADENADLLTVTYKKAQKEGPEFLTVFQGIDQSVDVHISTLVFHAAPEPVLMLYDFIMTTFVPKPEAETGKAQIESPAPQAFDVAQVQKAEESGKIHVQVRLASVQVVLVNDGMNLATLALSTAYVSVLLRPRAMRVSGRLGSLSVNDDSIEYAVRPEFRQMLSIEGEKFADFDYETFDPQGEHYSGVKSSISLKTESVKVHFLEQPLHDIYLFLAKLARLKGFYDAATQAAVQSASEIEIELMRYDISVKSPILIFPSDPVQKRDVLVLRLGEVSAQNETEKVVNKIRASLTGVHLASQLYSGEELSTLNMIEDININAMVTQTQGINRSQDVEFPDTQIAVEVSDIRLHLTQAQYKLLIALSQAIPQVLQGAPEGAAQADSIVSEGSSSTREPSTSGQEVAESNTALQPELVSKDAKSWTTVDLVLTIKAIKLRLYDANATTDASLRDHGIARFALNDNSVRFKMLSDGSGEAEVVLKSFTVGNTRPGPSKFKEIIPAAQHQRNQFMILYTFSGGNDRSSMAVVTIDSPEVVFTIEPVLALAEFFTSAMPAPQPSGEGDIVKVSESQDATPSQSSLSFRVDLHDASISVLENDTDSQSQAIRLTIKQILLAQQGVLALTIDQLGMSLVKMGTKDSVRFLDDVDMSFTLDSRSSSAQNLTSIEITAKPIVFRASYRDINLITAIINKAIELSNKAQERPKDERDGSLKDKTMSLQPAKTKAAISQISKGNAKHSVGKARVIVSKEQLKASFDGFRLVLIGDLHEQPMLHLKVKPFIFGAKDWTGQLHSATTMAVHITYWNLTNSHWEPLIDPWTFTTTVSKADSTSALDIKLSSRERLDVNLSATFAELALTTAKMWSNQGEQLLRTARGSYAPYRLQNNTGSPIYVWSDSDGSSESRDRVGIKLQTDETADWRFDDWKTLREHVSSSGQQHNIGIEFVDKHWEKLRSIPVDREGEFVFPLRPRTAKYSDRLLCEVKVVDNVKVVTIRSTYKVDNQTLYPLELTMVDEKGQPAHSLVKIAPGHDYSLPLEAVMKYRVRIQPDQGFGYKWCTPIRWEDLLARKGFTIKCPHTDSKEAAFRFQAWVQTDLDSADATFRKHPKIHLKLRAPLEIENLLPYNVQYRVYDKDTDQNWKSYLRKGGVMPVHSIELGHLVLLNVEIQDTVFKPSDFSIINTNKHSDFEIEKRLTLLDPQKRKLDVKLNYVRYPESGGAFKVQMYSPFLIVNKLGLPVSVRSMGTPRTTQEIAGDTRPDALASTTPRMLSHHQANGQQFAVRVGESGWSKPFSLEAPAADSTLAIPSQKQKADEIHVGLSWTEGLGKYKLSKVITLAPRFIVKNNLDRQISFREHRLAPREQSTIDPGQKLPLLFVRADSQKLLTIALSGLDAQWSPPFSVDNIGSVYFRLRVPGEEQSQLIQADVQISGSTIFVSLNVTQNWPFLIENLSDYTVTLSQKEAEKEDTTNTKPTYPVTAKSAISYAWDYPAAQEKKLKLTINSRSRLVDIMEIGDLVPFKFTEDKNTRAVSLDVRADGQKQVLRITNYNPDLSLYKMRSKSVSGPSPARQDTMSSNAEAFEAITEQVPPTLAFSIDFAGLGVSLINKGLIEIVYVSVLDMKFEYTASPAAQAVNVSFGTLQIDNQLHDAIFPVILQPTPMPKGPNGVASLPTVQLSVIWLNDQEHGVFFVKYMSVLLQALTIEVDEDLLFTLYDLTQIKGVSWEEGTEDILVQNEDEIPEPTPLTGGSALYFEVLELQPVKLFLSFMRTERVNDDQKLSIKNPLAVVLNALTMAVGNVNDAPLEFNALAIKDMRLTTEELTTRVTHHYSQEVLRQLYRVIGSADFIGNPIGLFTNVSSGVADIFYEPFNGAVMHGNRELGVGIAKGAASFAKKTVFGFSDSLTKFTGSVGKGISAATFDAEWQNRRKIAQRRNKPRHLIYGLASGGEALASSVASGLEGVLVKPIEGAESEGAFGFFKGVGKGMIGLAAKPVVGALDLVSNIGEGIRNTTTVFDTPERDRVRMPRLIPADGYLRPYDAREALGQYWLKDLNNGIYRREHYVAHINMPGSDNVVLLTDARLLSFWTKHLRLEWDLSFTQIQGVTVEDTGIRFGHKAGRAQDRFVVIPDKSSQSWFFEKIASVVKTFNVKRRMTVD